MSWYCHDCAKEAYERCCKICGQTRGEQRRKVTAHDQKAFQVRGKETVLPSTSDEMRAMEDRERGRKRAEHTD